MSAKKKFSNKKIWAVNNYKSYSDVFKDFFSIAKIIKFIVVLICIFCVLSFWKYLIFASQSMMWVITKWTVETISKQLWTDMKRDDFGNVNILLVGHGGSNHAGGYLADTIIVASWNPELWVVTMVSVPRDLYIHVKEPRIIGKINKIFASAYFRFDEFGDVVDEESKHDMRMDYASKTLASKVWEIMWLNIPYYAIVDFQHFEELVDHLGGIVVDVPSWIYDRTYPWPNNTYQTFQISEWVQLLDGATALKYARSRHTTSDFSRSHRQQMIIEAVLSTILDKNNLSNVSKLKSLFDDYQKMIYTNVVAKEIIGMIKYKDNLKDIFSYNFTTECIVWNYKKTPPGCFLYTPSKDQFNWSSVILPNDATSYNVSFYDYTQNFLFFVAHHQEYLLENPRISLQNGISKSFARELRKQASWHASKLATKLKKYAFNIVDVDNSEEDHEETTIYIAGTGSYPVTIELLNDYFLDITNIMTWQQLWTGIDMAIVLWNSYLVETDWVRFDYDKLR